MLRFCMTAIKTGYLLTWMSMLKIWKKRWMNVNDITVIKCGNKKTARNGVCYKHSLILNQKF